MKDQFPFFFFHKVLKRAEKCIFFFFQKGALWTVNTDSDLFMLFFEKKAITILLISSTIKNRKEAAL